MRCWVASGLILILVIVSAASVRAAELPEVQKVLTTSQKLMQERRFDRAAGVLKNGYEAYVRVGRGEEIGALELRHNLAAAYYLSGKFDQALAEFDAVRNIREQKLGLHHEHTRGAYQSMVSTLLKMQQDAKAEELLQTFAKKTEEETSPDFEQLIWALDWIKEIQQNSRRYDEAYGTSERLRAATLRRNPDRSDPDYLKLTLNASAILGIQGKLDESLKLLSDALAQAKLTKDNVGVLTQHRLNQSSILNAQSRDEEALGTLQVGLQEIGRLGPIKGKVSAELLVSIGSIILRRGEPRAAETYIDRALELLTEAYKGSGTLPQDDPNFVKGYAFLGTILAADGQKDAALSALQFSFDQYQQLISAPDAEWLKIGLLRVRALTQFGFLNEAEGLLVSLQKFYGGGGGVRAIQLRGQMCALLRSKGKLSDAASECRTAEGLLAQENTATRLDRIQFATDAILAYAAVKDQAGVHRVSQGIFQDAVASPREARSVRNLYKPLLSASLDALPKGRPLSDNDLVATDLIFRTLQILRQDEGDDNAGRLGRLRSSVTGADRRTALRREYFRLRLDRARNRLTKFALSSDDFQKDNTNIRTALLTEVSTVESALAAAGKESGSSDWEATPLPRYEPASIDAVRGQLTAGEALVFYQVLPDKTFSLTIRPDSVVLNGIVFGHDKLSELASKIRPRDHSSLPEVEDRRNDLLRGFDAKAAYLLYRTIWPTEALKEISTVFVVPDGPVASISIPSLLTKEAAPPKSVDDLRTLPWLLKEGVIISAIPNPKVLTKRTGEGRAGEPFLVGIGDPLPPPCGVKNDSLRSATSDSIDPSSLCEMGTVKGAMDEINFVASNFPKERREIRLKADATEKQLRQLNETGVLGRASVVIFATHGLAPGELDETNDLARTARQDKVYVPMVGQAVDNLMASTTKMSKAELKKFSGSLMMSVFTRDVPDIRFRFPPGLLLSNDPASAQGDSTNDGFLSAPEITLLDMNADLVILSACNTASESFEFEPTTFSGLAQAFLTAGGKSLVVSHWSVVSSAAKEMTVHFMKRLTAAGGQRPAAALREAMKDFLQTVEDPHPYVWAPFFYVGTTARVSL